MRAPIPLHVLAGRDEKRLIRRYRLRRELAEVIAHRPPVRRSDLLDREDVKSIATPEEVRLLMREPRVDPDAPVKESVRRSGTVVRDGLVLGFLDLDHARRAYIADGQGEIISAELDPASRLGMRISTVRLLGWTLPEIGALEETYREKGHARLGVLRGTRAHELWHEKDLQVPGDVPARVFQVLSALLNGVLHMTRPQDYSALEGGGLTSGGTEPGPGVIVPPAEEEAQCGPGSGWLADAVPELNIVECCAAHDACYGRGCTSCDRAKCDQQFYACILPKAGPAVATLYYNAVTAFGQWSFNYCDGPPGLGGTISVGVGIAVGVGIGVVAGPVWGVAAGTLATAVSIGANRVLCALCEEVKEWECTAWEEHRYRECAERREQRERRCRNWSRWFRWLCRAWKYFTYWMCVAWTWIVSRVCIAGQWLIVALTC